MFFIISNENQDKIFHEQLFEWLKNISYDKATYRYSVKGILAILGYFLGRAWHNFVAHLFVALDPVFFNTQWHHHEQRLQVLWSLNQVCWLNIILILTLDI